MNQQLLQYPETDRGDKENLMPSAVLPDTSDSNRRMPKLSSSFALGSSSSQKNDLLEQDRRSVRSESVCPHPDNHFQESHCPLSEMSLATLAKYCTQETNKYQQRKPSDGRYGLEIFRRAVALCDHDAWEMLQHQFEGNVHFWFIRHTYRKVALRYENEQVYIDCTFQRFWQAASNQTLTFTSLAGALHYLRSCLHCTIMDTLRTYAHPRLEALPEEGAPDEPQIEDHYHESELWDTLDNLLTNERERRVAYLHFHCNLKPREIMRHCPGEFVSEVEIYRLKRNLKDRVMRSSDKIRWLLDDADP